jgi:hypothetical protein
MDAYPSMVEESILVSPVLWIIQPASVNEYYTVLYYLVKLNQKPCR